MLAEKLNYGDTVGVVGVSSSIDKKAKQNFCSAFLIKHISKF